MKRALTGILAPVVTPFESRSGDVATKAFVANIKAHLDAGLDGILVAGSTGEAALLTEDERHAVLIAARRVVPTEKWLLAGIGGESTRVTSIRARESAKIGADAVLVVSPHYYTAAMTEEALRDHFTRVADESPIPILLYNIPKYAHFALSPELVSELSRHPNIAGMKDSAGDLPTLERYLKSQSDSFTVLTGNGPTFAQALALGVRGGILAAALFAPELSREVYDAWKRGDRAAAMRAQERLTPSAKEIVGELGIGAVKAALETIGLHGGEPRSPLRPITAAVRQRVQHLMRSVAAAPVS
jgi:4-hydroxy-2-oxoglutarate aldolase